MQNAFLGHLGSKQVQLRRHHHGKAMVAMVFQVLSGYNFAKLPGNTLHGLQQAIIEPFHFEAMTWVTLRKPLQMQLPMAEAGWKHLISP